MPELYYGMINPESYEGKILLLYKESNTGKAEDADPDGIGWLKKYIAGTLEDANARKAATKIMRTAFLADSLLENPSFTHEGLCDRARNFRDSTILNRIAFSNIKKNGGGTRANDNAVIQYLDEGHHLKELEEEIKSYHKPGVVLNIFVGGSAYYFAKLLQILPKSKDYRYIRIPHYAYASYKKVALSISQALEEESRDSY